MINTQWRENNVFSHIGPLPPCVEGTFRVTSLLLTGRGSLVSTFPATVTGLPVIWNVWPEVVVIEEVDDTSVLEARRQRGVRIRTSVRMGSRYQLKPKSQSLFHTGHPGRRHIYLKRSSSRCHSWILPEL